MSHDTSSKAVTEGDEDVYATAVEGISEVENEKTSSERSVSPNSAAKVPERIALSSTSLLGDDTWECISSDTRMYSESNRVVIYGRDTMRMLSSHFAASPATIVILGPRGSGKTTVMCNVFGHGSSRFVRVGTERVSYTRHEFGEEYGATPICPARVFEVHQPTEGFQAYVDQNGVDLHAIWYVASDTELTEREYLRHANTPVVFVVPNVDKLPAAQHARIVTRIREDPYFTDAIKYPIVSVGLSAGGMISNFLCARGHDTIGIDVEAGSWICATCDETGLFLTRPIGYEEIAQKTYDAIDIRVRTPFALAQSCSFQVSKAQSVVLIRAFAATAGGIGLIPMPFVGVPALVSLQVTMIHQLCKMFNVPAKHQDILIAKLTGAAAGGGSALLAAELVKAYPGLGTLAGCIITSAIASSSTLAIGKYANTYLIRVINDNVDCPMPELSDFVHVGSDATRIVDETFAWEQNGDNEDDISWLASSIHDVVVSTTTTSTSVGSDDSDVDYGGQRLCQDGTA
mmetsp:Transcript_25019/g.49832  ORF Transcript_25019/g.49832 Transcript_25019/m.49832 type:complete len:516 (+) Transcript_25019:141-1688(+)